MWQNACKCVSHVQGIGVDCCGMLCNVVFVHRWHMRWLWEWCVLSRDRFDCRDTGRDGVQIWIVCLQKHTKLWRKLHRACLPDIQQFQLNAIWHLNSFGNIGLLGPHFPHCKNVASLRPESTILLVQPLQNGGYVSLPHLTLSKAPVEIHRKPECALHQAQLLHYTQWRLCKNKSGLGTTWYRPASHW